MRAKVARQARRTEERRQAERARRESSRRRQRIVLWPALALAVAGVFAALYFFKQSESQAPEAKNTAGSGYPFAVGTPGPGKPAPAIRLPSTKGGMFDLAAYKGKEPVLLYFQEGLTCQPCWDQIAAIDQEREKFRALGIKTIVSITTDPFDLIKQKAEDEGFTMPVVADEGARVSDTYDARTYSMTWMKPPRDGHSFILVGNDGRIRWRADYGGPPKYTMFLPVDAIITDLRSGLSS